MFCGFSSVSRKFLFQFTIKTTGNHNHRKNKQIVIVFLYWERLQKVGEVWKTCRIGSLEENVEILMVVGVSPCFFFSPVRPLPPVRSRLLPQVELSESPNWVSPSALNT